MRGGEPRARARRWRIPEAAEPGRLDRWLVGQGLDLGRRGLARLFAEGRVRMDGHRVPKAARVIPGALVEIDLPAERRARPEPEAPLHVAFEAARQLVVCKPPGQPTAPRSGDEPGTLASALVGHYPELGAVGAPLEPGLVHRLDTWTSGLLWVARDAEALSLARCALAAGALDKRYLCLVVDRAELRAEGVVSAWLAPSRDPARVRVATPGEPGAREARTTWRVLRRCRGVALIEASAPRAFRHQVRRHLAHAGHPLLNDLLYGGLPVPDLGARHALHASRLTFAGAGTLEGFSVESALPDDLAAILESGLAPGGEAELEPG